MSGFVAPVAMLPLEDGRHWRLLGDLVYVTRAGYSIRVRETFTTDFASIPRLFYTLIGPPWGRYGWPAVVHDYLYRYPGLHTRGDADRIFIAAMDDRGVAAWRRGLMYQAVRLAGGGPWRRYRRADRAGVWSEV